MTDPKRDLVYEALRFALWAAGEGLCPAPHELAKAPEDFLFEYSERTGGSFWEGIPEAVTAEIFDVDATALSSHHRSTGE